LKEVYTFESAGTIDFDNKNRKLSEVSPVQFESDQVSLKPGAYKIIYNEYVRIPMDMAAMCLPRSSLVRCGATLGGSPLWDPGYEGRGAGMLVVHNPKGITLHRNAKIGQLVFIKLAESTDSLYSGQYKGENK
jgi:dUTP pyrophosphatase